MQKLLLLCAILVFLTSCRTVTIGAEVLSEKSLTCDKVISKSVAIVLIRNDGTYYDHPENKTSQAEEQYIFLPLEKRLINAHCFEKVKIFRNESLAKDFDRIIKIQIKTETFSNLEMTGRAFWMFASASTLFIMPYSGSESYDLIFEDSVTEFKKLYPLKTDYTAHIFYFFREWNLFGPPTDVINGVIDDFFNELKAKS